MSTSFEEKSVWIQLIGLSLGLGAYFIVAGRMLAAGVLAMSAFATVLMVAVSAMVIFLIVAYALAVIVAKSESRDERDRFIAWCSEYNSSWIIGAGVLAAITCMVFGVENVWTANLLLLSLAISEIFGLILQLVYYRRGT